MQANIDFLNDYGFFLETMNQKTPYVVVQKNTFALSNREIFSFLRVRLLFTVIMDHPVAYR